jgi:hypothetical protein
MNNGNETYMYTQNLEEKKKCYKTPWLVEIRVQIRVVRGGGKGRILLTWFFLGLVSESDFSKTSRTEQPSDCPVRIVYYSPTMSDSRTEVGQVGQK